MVDINKEYGALTRYERNEIENRTVITLEKATLVKEGENYEITYNKKLLNRAIQGEVAQSSFDQVEQQIQDRYLEGIKEKSQEFVESMKSSLSNRGREYGDNQYPYLSLVNTDEDIEPEQLVWNGPYQGVNFLITQEVTDPQSFLMSHLLSGMATSEPEKSTESYDLDYLRANANNVQTFIALQILARQCDGDPVEIWNRLGENEKVLFRVKINQLNDNFPIVIDESVDFARGLNLMARASAEYAENSGSKDLWEIATQKILYHQEKGVTLVAAKDYFTPAEDSSSQKIAHCPPPVTAKDISGGQRVSTYVTVIYDSSQPEAKARVEKYQNQCFALDPELRDPLLLIDISNPEWFNELREETLGKATYHQDTINDFLSAWDECEVDEL